MRRWIALIAVVVCSWACSIDPRLVGFDGVSAIRVQGDVSSVELLLHNNLQREIYIDSGAITLRMKSEELVTFTLREPLRIPPRGEVMIPSVWSIRRDDPATIYAMRHHPIERYMDRMTIDYTIAVSGVTKRQRVLSKRGVKVADMRLNIEGEL